MSHRHFTLEDRNTIQNDLDDDVSHRDIALKLGVSHTAINKEVRNNSVVLEVTVTKRVNKPRILSLDLRTRRGKGEVPDKMIALSRYKERLARWGNGIRTLHNILPSDCWTRPILAHNSLLSRLLLATRTENITLNRSMWNILDSMLSRKFKSITNRILVMKFMSEFIFIYPLITIMYGDRGGVDAAGIGMIVAVGFVCSILLEIPTGIFADSVARKYVILIGLSVNTIGLSLWYLFPSFIGYMIAAVVFALGYALESGSWQAYLYGVLPDNDKKSFGKFWARVSAMVMISYTTAYVLTSIIGVQYELLIALSIVSVVIALGIGILLPKDSITTSEEELRPKIFRSAITHILGSKQLMKLLLSTIIVVGTADIAIEYGGLYFDQIGVETRYVPLIIALGNIMGAITFWTLHSWEHILEKHKIAFMTLGLMIFTVSFFGGLVVATAGMLLFTRFVRVLEVQLDSAIQHVALDKNRATIASIGSFGAKMFGAGMALSIGFFSVNNSIVSSLRISFIFAGLAFIVLHSFLRYRHKQSPV